MRSITNWRTPSRSNGSNGSCVEVGTAGNVVGVRDTKDRSGGQVEFDQASWSRFVAAL